jgi:outer membrane protein
VFLSPGKTGIQYRVTYFNHVVHNMRLIVHSRVKHRNSFVILLFFAFSCFLSGQKPAETLPSKVTLSQCISYAIANQALIKQSLIDEEITGKEIRIALSGWYPQLGVDASAQRNLQIPLSSYPNQIDPAGPPFTAPSAATYGSSGTFYASQTLFNPDLYHAARISKELRNQAAENSENTRIDLYVNVTKSFFDVLLTEEQIRVLDEDILRLQRNYKDAYNLYQNGLTDNIDFQRAEISLSNVKAQRKAVEEALKAKYALLKQFMGVTPEKELTLLYDTTRYENEILVDTARSLDYSKRIEYKLLQSTMALQGSQVSYYKLSILPSVSAFFNYNPKFGNDDLSLLYNKAVPSSMAGLKLSLPLFQGMNRLANVSRAKLQYRRMEYEMDYLKSRINTEYVQSLSTYKSNLNEMRIAKNNIAIARKIFNTVKLQYDKGIKAYLEVIVSETDLRTAELNYLNMLFQVLTSKMDFEKASGLIKIN